MKIFICVLAMVAMAAADGSDEGNLLLSPINEFTSKIFLEVAKSNVGKSVVMSGYSAMSPLAQLALASVGESHDEILGVMGLPNDNVTKATFSALNQKIRTIKGVEMKIANKVYIPEGYTLDEQFAATSREVFQSDVQAVDFFKSTEAANIINTWVEDNTNKRIKDLVDADSLGPDTRGVLINAIYFKGSWKEKFDKDLTVDRDFHVTKDKTIQLPTMFKNDYFRYGYSQELKAKLLEIFYEGGESSFLIILPDEIDGLSELEEKLKDTSLLHAATESMYETKVEVYIPKFQIETKIDLKAVLQNMGINKLFDVNYARLENLLSETKTGLFVSDAVQKAFIEVNEDGAEAAVASEYMFVVGSAPGVVEHRNVFRLDRPFYFSLKFAGIDTFSGVFVDRNDEKDK